MSDDASDHPQGNSNQHFYYSATSRPSPTTAEAVTRFQRQIEDTIYGPSASPELSRNKLPYGLMARESRAHHEALLENFAAAVELVCNGKARDERTRFRYTFERKEIPLAIAKRLKTGLLRLRHEATLGRCQDQVAHMFGHRHRSDLIHSCGAGRGS